jgi:hypothetical protein
MATVPSVTVGTGTPSGRVGVLLLDILGFRLSICRKAYRFSRQTAAEPRT